MQAFEYTGIWWLPATQERQVAGTVKFVNNDQIILSLQGFLAPVDPYSEDQLNAYDLILGQTNEGQTITLADCQEISRASTLIDEIYGEQQYSATIAYIGTHFLSPDAIQFQTMDIHYSHLAQWAGVFPFRGYQSPFEEVSAMTDKGTISVRPILSVLEPDFIQKRDILSEEQIPEAVCIHVQAIQPLSLQEWSEQFITPLQNLLTLATQHANTVLHLRAYLLPRNVAFSPLGNLELSSIESVVQIIYPEARQFIEPLDTVFPETLFFSLNDIAARFSQVVDSWLKSEEDLDSVSDLYFGVQYSELYLSQRFLFIAQAAESLQNRRDELPDHSEVEHQKLVVLLLDACPELYKEWLAEVLEHSNKANFRKKLKRLYQLTKSILSPLVGDTSKDRDIFADRVYITRNYLTHYDKKLKSQSATGKELFFLMGCLTIAIQTSLLYELGFTPEQCVSMFEKSRLYQWLQQQQKYRSI